LGKTIAIVCANLSRETNLPDMIKQANIFKQI